MNMTRVMKLSDVRIKGSFKNSFPNDYKLAQCREYWNRHGFYLHDIVVDNKGYLVDGYIQYLVLKENGIEDVVFKGLGKKVYKRSKPKVRKCGNKKVKSYRDTETLYVFGVHPGRSKERVWRVPNKFQKEWESILNVGDTVLVKTKRGKAPIKVTRIEKLSECPIDMPVKKVVKKISKYTKKMIDKEKKNMNYNGYNIFGIKKCEKTQPLSLSELESTVHEITKKQNYISNCGLSAEVTALVIKELQEQKKELLELMHKKVDEL